MLVCGGIGVTPIASIYCELAAEYGSGELPSLSEVRVVWAARDGLELFDSFHENFATPHAAFSVACHVTQVTAALGERDA